MKIISARPHFFTWTKSSEGIQKELKIDFLTIEINYVNMKEMEGIPTTKILTQYSPHRTEILGDYKNYGQTKRF